MKLAAIIIVSLALFIAAAAWHGKQLRIERERAGYNHVTFGGENPPFVEALWHAERLRFWPASIAIAVALLITALVLKRHYAVFAIAAILWGPTLSFVVLGIWSSVRSR